MNAVKVGLAKNSSLNYIGNYFSVKRFKGAKIVVLSIDFLNRVLKTNNHEVIISL